MSDPVAVDRLLVDIGADGRVSVSAWLSGHYPRTVEEPGWLRSPLDSDNLAQLRWYLEDYLRMPYGAHEDRAREVEAKFPGWGAALFDTVFGAGAGRDAYVRVRARGTPSEIVVQSELPEVLGLPWELMRDPSDAGFVALDAMPVTRMVARRDLDTSFSVTGSRLRMLMVISRPQGDFDIGYRMIARPLMRALKAVRGAVDVVVLRPPTLDRLREVLNEAYDNGEPFQVVHFDGHGTLSDGPDPEGMLLFERDTGGPDWAAAADVARVLADGHVPLIVLNACQSGAMGRRVEAAVATGLLSKGAASVVAMAYRVYAVAAAEFMTEFYDRLFAGDRVADAVFSGRARLARRNARPSLRGPLPLVDWMVPVHYASRDVRFPGLRAMDERDVSPEALLERAPDVTKELNDPLRPVGEFVGRDVAFYQLEVALRVQRVVVLHGPGGTGKTELAKAFGRWWRDTGGVQRPDFVVWHSFAPGAGDSGLDGVLSGIGSRVFGGGFDRLDPAERQQAVRSLLSTRRLLLIWDNVETLHTMPDPTGVTPALDEGQRASLLSFLAEVSAGGTSAVLLTSRSRELWLGDVARIGVGGFTPDEAVEYADQLLQGCPVAGRRRGRASFAELMAWLDGHPLAMRLVLPHLSRVDAGQLLAALRGSAPLPEGLSADDAGCDVGDVGRRNATLAAGVAYSYRHLSAATRRVLPVVGLFQGTVDAAVLAAMSTLPDTPERFRGLDGRAWARMLDRAAAVGLLTPLGDLLYGIHPALPAFLAARWRQDASDEYDTQRSAATRGLLDGYCAFCDVMQRLIRTGAVSQAFERIDVQRRTLSAMLGYAIDHGLWPHVARLLPPLTEYWNNRGLRGEARVWSDRIRLASEAADGTPPALDADAGRIWMSTVLAQATYATEASHVHQAEREGLQVLDQLRQMPDGPARRGALAVTALQLAGIAQQGGRYVEAERWSRQAVALLEESADRGAVAAGYHFLGAAVYRLGRLDEAEQWYRKALTINKQCGDRLNQAESYHQLGALAQECGRLTEAEDWYRRAFTIVKEAGNATAVGGACHALGYVAHQDRRFADAEQWYHQALTSYSHSNDLSWMSHTYHNLGLLAEQRDRLDEAEQWYRRALDAGAGLTPPDLTHLQLGIVAHRRGDLAEAQENYDRALTGFQQRDDHTGAAIAFHNGGIAAHRQGDLGLAERLLRQSLALRENEGPSIGAARTLGQLGLLAEELGQPLEALQWTVRCLSALDEMTSPTAQTALLTLQRLAKRIGSQTVDACWRETTGHPPPAPIQQLVYPHAPAEETAQ